MASASRIDKIIGLFCKRALQKRQYSAKETYNLIDLTDRSHPIPMNTLVLKTSVQHMPHSTHKMHIHPCKHARATVQQLPQEVLYTQSLLAWQSLPRKPMQRILQSEFCTRNHQNPRQPMTHPQLRCHTGIIRSSTLVRAIQPIARTRSLATQPIFPRAFPRTSGIQCWCVYLCVRVRRTHANTRTVCLSVFDC